MNEHQYTDEIVCPYCGYTFKDSCEEIAPEECEEIDCEDCKKTFSASANMSISYVTRKLKEMEEPLNPFTMPSFTDSRFQG